MINVYTDSQIFTNVVFESTQKLITNGIWPIDPLVYRAWKKNFVTKEENFLCACLLDSLLFRTDNQIISSYSSIFNQHLPSLQMKYSTEVNVSRDILPLLKKRQGLVKLVTVNSSDSAGKSSHVLANLLRKKFDIHSDNIIPPSDIDYFYQEATQLFIFIDDFLGSGKQFESQLDRYIEKKWPKGLIVYFPLIGHERGIKSLEVSHPNVIIKPVEVIREDYCFFKKYFSDYENSDVSCKQFYEKFMTRFGFTDDLYGFEDLGVSVAFEHSCPDNSLLVFNGKGQPGFNKLF